MNIVSAVILCTIVGAIGAVVLVLAAKFMAVEEDPRIEEVSACLAGANCGGCGYAGCADYAKAVVMDGVPCDKCAPGGPKAAAAIAKIMGGEASAVEKKAVVQCQGNSEHCKPSYEYKGIQTCAAAATLYGGPKTCTFACIGLGDCTKVCKFDAIHIVDGVAKVDKDKCTGCGACANICPKHVIMIDAGGPRKPVVMCSNQDKGAVANKLCTTSCIACGMCERTCKFDAIHVVDGVARIDYDKCKGCGYATVIAQAVSALLCLIYIVKKFPILRLSEEDFRISFQSMGRLLALGIPMGLQFSITAIGTIIVQGAVNIYGAVMAADFHSKKE